MKEFDKWFSIFPPNDAFRKYGRDMTASAAWAAALRWVQNQCIRKDDEMCADCGCYSDIKIIIKKELNNTS